MNNEFQAKEEQWMLVIQTSHRLFCDCLDYRRHFFDLTGWPTPTDPGTGGDTGLGTGGEDMVVPSTADSALLAALEEAERIREDTEELRYA